MSPKVPEAYLEARRTEILEAAHKCFMEKGFHYTTMQDIYKAASLSPGAVYNYFSSKEELFAAVLQEACRRVADRYREVAHDPSTKSALRSLAQSDVEVLRQEEAFMKVLVREAMSFQSNTYPLIIENMGPIQVLIQSILERGQGKHEVRTDRPVPMLAQTFIGMLSLLYIQHWGSGGVWPSLTEIPDLAVELFLEGARYPGPSTREHK